MTSETELSRRRFLGAAAGLGIAASGLAPRRVPACGWAARKPVSANEKIVLGLIGAIVIGGFAFLGVQIGRLDAKIDSLGTRISAENATTRQELIGIATAVSNSITAARQMQPQIVSPPAPTPQQPPGQPGPGNHTPPGSRSRHTPGDRSRK